MPRLGVALLLIAASTGLARGDGIRPFKPAGAPVPPTQEIEVLDPGVDPTGKPAVLLHPTPLGQVVDVPPAVLVHRFYYTGDRTFQAQLLPGGPVIVSVSHPQTMERVYVPLTMPPGAPKVTYTAHEIRYDFGPQSVTLKFGVCGKPTVCYSQSTQLHEKARLKVQACCDTTKDLYRRTGIPDCCRQLHDGTKQLLGATADAYGSAKQTIMSPIYQGMSSLGDAVRPAGNATKPLSAEPFAPRGP